MSVQGHQVVLGGAGLMGQALVRRLLREGSRRITVVDVVAPDSDISRSSCVHFVEGDVVEMDRRDIEGIVEDAEVLFYKAGKLGNPLHSSDIEHAWEYISVNALALARMAPVLRLSGLRKVIVDSSIAAVSDFRRVSPVSETDGAGGTTNFYGVSKAILEDVCRFYDNREGPRFFLIRYPRVYSPVHESFLFNFARRIQNGEPIHLFGDEDKLIDLVHIDDAVEVAFRCMEFDGDERVFHVAYGDAKSLRQIVDLLRSMAGVPDYPVEMAEGGVSPVEPSRAQLADTYSAQRLGLEYRYSIEKIVEDALRVVGVLRSSDR